jgi:hypothetical protein
MVSGKNCAVFGIFSQQWKGENGKTSYFSMKITIKHYFAEILQIGAEATKSEYTIYRMYFMPEKNHVACLRFIL